MLEESLELPGGRKTNLYYKIDNKGYINIVNKKNKSDINNSLQYKIICKLSSILLPIGYPSSVTNEYMEYQLYDTIQELCGYLKGIVMNQASLTGLGVGDSSVKISNILLTWTIKDLITMLLGLYVSTLGSKIYGANMKIFWFTSSLISAICGFLTLFAAIYTKYYGILLIISSILNTIGGVPGGIAKASLSHHLAKNKNYSDVAAKEGNQNKMSKLFMIYIAYQYIKYMANDIILAWITYILLVIIQLICIYKSIQTLILTDINHSRIELILNAWFIQKNINNMTPKTVAKTESMKIFKVLHFFINDYTKWNIYFGKSLKDLDDKINIKKYIQIFKGLNYLIVINNKYSNNILIFLNKNITSKQKILAYSIAYLVRLKLNKLKNNSDDEIFEIIKHCINNCNENGDKLLDAMIKCEWDINDVKFCDQGWTFKVSL